MKTACYTMFLSGLLVAGNVLAATVPGPVVDADWLKAHADEVTTLQLSSSLKNFKTAPRYAKVDGKKKLVGVSGHVPGAHYVNFEKIRVTRNIDGKKVKALIPEKADFQKLARSWGVNKEDAIVIVPTGNTPLDVDEATRLYWQFKYFGQTNMAILDGGMHAWIAAGNKVATNAPKSSKGNWTAAAEDKSLLATRQDVEQALSGKNVEVVDARPQNQYMGVFTKPHEKSGHLPGAKDFSPDLQVTTAGPARFLSPASYSSIMKSKGINPSSPTISYCNTGHLASGTWFISHEVLGNHDSKLYDGSMVEYSEFPGDTVNPAGNQSK